MTRPLLLVMTKLPQVGAVKRRLTKDIGALGAWRFYRNNLTELLRRFGRSPFWSTKVLLTPARARYRWPKQTPTIAQGHGDLGERMLTGLRAGARGQPVIVIGCDIPGIETEHLRSAFAALRANDAVFGPAMDGGYWLVGLSGRRRLWRPFTHVRWSTAQALVDTLANLRNRKVGRAATLQDVDDLKSFLATSAP
ncbi:MAG: TIGR04282 family arsenosugar biosynthesis glycosyltransferase [Rhodospirillaceae bacterium]|nr:TIGR04282 family arsenosugar biosynthesis glycosyltransferase [Rhodospirillaceae bacterium]